MIARVPQGSAVSAATALILSSKLGLVSVPDTDLVSLSREEALDRNAVRELLRTLGANLGMTLLARKDEGFPDADADAVPPVFADQAVRKSLEGLDAVWMDGEEVVACFVAESGFGGWESVRRLADLVALHPKLKAPLYAVTLPSLKAGLVAEIHRPAFLLPKKPLAEVLRLLEWDKIKGEVDQLGERVRYLKPEFLEGVSEPVTPPKAD
ncbi:MAG: hypothetical protein JWP91_3640 [Fibrobacteres bacterium]|nr:hypothetical protein [Fibrobacterota bacterium]